MIESLIHEAGWEEVPSKNPKMYSFVKGNKRMNVYFTTMTITIQSPNIPCLTWREVDRELMKQILAEN